MEPFHFTGKSDESLKKDAYRTYNIFEIHIEYLEYLVALWAKTTLDQPNDIIDKHMQQKNGRPPGVWKR